MEKAPQFPALLTGTFHCSCLVETPPSGLPCMRIALLTLRDLHGNNCHVSSPVIAGASIDSLNQRQASCEYGAGGLPFIEQLLFGLQPVFDGMAVFSTLFLI